LGLSVQLKLHLATGRDPYAIAPFGVSILWSNKKNIYQPKLPPKTRQNVSNGVENKDTQQSDAVRKQKKSGSQPWELSEGSFDT